MDAAEQLFHIDAAEQLLEHNIEATERLQTAEADALKVHEREVIRLRDRQVQHTETLRSYGEILAYLRSRHG